MMVKNKSNRLAVVACAAILLAANFVVAGPHPGKIS